MGVVLEYYGGSTDLDYMRRATWSHFIFSFYFLFEKQRPSSLTWLGTKLWGCDAMKKKTKKRHFTHLSIKRWKSDEIMIFSFGFCSLSCEAAPSETLYLHPWFPVCFMCMWQQSVVTTSVQKGYYWMEITKWILLRNTNLKLNQQWSLIIILGIITVM